ncbi:hypothetical protein [Micromonospora sp. DT47]|uniref:hypothetical protein n=1 Tax=Micromonospora sp. DT47 TaxID=3393431 RepID=UPI003CF969AF
MLADQPSSRRPLGAVPRALITAMIMLGVIVPSLVISELIEDRTGSGVLADFGAIAVPTATTAWLAPRVSYRRRDALWWLAGGVGIYVFGVIAWRLALLPYRDWTPRPEEASQARYQLRP